MDLLQTFVLTVALVAGASPNFARFDGSAITEEPRYSLETSVEASILDETFFVGVDTITWAAKAPEGYTFSPRSDRYTVRAGIRFSIFEVGWSHYCQHPVVSYDTGSPEMDNIFEGSDTLYLRMEAKFNPFGGAK